MLLSLLVFLSFTAEARELDNSFSNLRRLLDVNENGFDYHYYVKNLARTGDLIFNASDKASSKAIRFITGSDVSHVAVVVVRDGKKHLLEASGVNGVNLYDLEERLPVLVRRRENGRIWVRQICEEVSKSIQEKVDGSGVTFTWFTDAEKKSLDLLLDCKNSEGVPFTYVCAPAFIASVVSPTDEGPIVAENRKQEYAKETGYFCSEIVVEFFRRTGVISYAARLKAEEVSPSDLDQARPSISRTFSPNTLLGELELGERTPITIGKCSKGKGCPTWQDCTHGWIDGEIHC